MPIIIRYNRRLVHIYTARWSFWALLPMDEGDKASEEIALSLLRITSRLSIAS